MKPVIRNMNDPRPSPVGNSRGAFIQVLLGPADGVPAFITRRFTLEPGGWIPAHRHQTIEHEQVMLEGEMILRLDGVEHTVRAGDCIFIPPGVAHAYANRGEASVRFLCIVPRTEEYGTEWLEPPAP